MVIKLLALYLCGMAAGIASASELRYAIVQMDGSGHGHLIAAAPLVRGYSVHIQYPAAAGGSACCKRLMASDFKKASSEELLATNEVSGEPVFVYRVRVPRLWYVAPFIGVAAVAKKMKTRNAGAELVSVERGQGIRRAGLCTSEEGVHLIERAGASERTHLYLSLGYAIESPACR